MKETPTPRTDSATLAKAMRILSQDIQSDDGVANAAIAEAADRIDQIERELAAAQERIQRLTEAGDFLELCLTGEEPFRSSAKSKWNKAKEGV